MSKAIDLTGQRFGKLTALRPTGETGKSGTVWECLCDCGNVHYAGIKTLRRGHTRSCGCMMRVGNGRKHKDLTGERFGKLTVLRLADGRDVNGGLMWECVCDCGNTTVVRSGSLVSGNTRSCGCGRRSKKAVKEE